MYFEIVHVTGNSQCAVATIGSEWSAYAIKSHNFVVRRKKDADNDEDFIPFFENLKLLVHDVE